MTDIIKKKYNIRRTEEDKKLLKCIPLLRDLLFAKYVSRSREDYIKDHESREKSQEEKDYFSKMKELLINNDKMKFVNCLILEKCYNSETVRNYNQLARDLLGIQFVEFYCRSDLEKASEENKNQNNEKASEEKSEEKDITKQESEKKDITKQEYKEKDIADVKYYNSESLTEQFEHAKLMCVPKGSTIYYLQECYMMYYPIFKHRYFFSLEHAKKYFVESNADGKGLHTIELDTDNHVLLFDKVVSEFYEWEKLVDSNIFVQCNSDTMNTKCTLPFFSRSGIPCKSENEKKIDKEIIEQTQIGDFSQEIESIEKICEQSKIEMSEIFFEKYGKTNLSDIIVSNMDYFLHLVLNNKYEQRTIDDLKKLATNMFNNGSINDETYQDIKETLDDPNIKKTTYTKTRHIMLPQFNKSSTQTDNAPQTQDLESFLKALFSK
jgi:hypothetical protein